MAGSVPGSVRAWPDALGMVAPISVRNLITTLNNLPPAATLYDSGGVDTGYVHSWAKVFLQSDGLGAFTGHIHESGAVGDNFLMVVTLLDVQDDSGNTLVFQVSGNVAGQVDFGTSDQDWQWNFSVPAIAEHWDTVKNNGGRIKTTLHVSTNPWYVTEDVVLGVLAAIGIVLGGAFFAHQDVQVQPQPLPYPYYPQQGPPYWPDSPAGAEYYYVRVS